MWLLDSWRAFIKPSATSFDLRWPSKAVRALRKKIQLMFESDNVLRLSTAVGERRIIFIASVWFSGVNIHWTKAFGEWTQLRICLENSTFLPRHSLPLKPIESHKRRRWIPNHRWRYNIPIYLCTELAWRRIYHNCDSHSIRQVYCDKLIYAGLRLEFLRWKHLPLRSNVVKHRLTF